LPIAVVGNACEVSTPQENYRWVVGLTNVIKMILGMDIPYYFLGVSLPSHTVPFDTGRSSTKAGRLEEVP